MPTRTIELPNGYFRYSGPVNWSLTHNCGSITTYVECLDPSGVLVASEGQDNPIWLFRRKIPMDQWLAGNAHISWAALEAVDLAKSLLANHSN